jgi:UDP-N-acetylglucosamine--N-acetylmuramyl-(pentapeptide) pyrophosphoryl-undecaprenol N-acetylglucosamine transferase
VNRRIVISAGGTGGHFYPGLVLAQTLAKRGWQPLMLVRTGDAALPRLEQAGLPAVALDVRGLSRRPSLDWAVFSWKLAGALRLAGRILRDFTPDVVVGMGGYLTFPAAFAARRRGIPFAVHESNAVMGLANRTSVALGAKLLRGLPPAAGEAPGQLTGTPVRPALWTAADAPAARRELGLAADVKTVLVFGGSQGARGLNSSLPAALAKAAPMVSGGVQVLHLAGTKSQDQVEALYAQAAVPSLRAKVLPYLEAMDKGYAAADLVICRSGASTIAELACQRKPALLVPFPHATGRHQDANARLLAQCGAARVVPESELEPRLAGELEDLLCARTCLPQMSEAYGRLALPCGAQAVQSLADAVERISRP